MDALMTWAKENVQLISLLVGLIGVVVAVISLIHELNERKLKKREFKNLIATKEAQLKAMRDASRLSMNAADYGRYHVDESQLEAEIEELKKQL